VSPCHSIVTAM